MPRVPLPPISGGLSEGTSENNQPRGTYIEGENVRGVEPTSGRVVWGAQRAGLERMGDQFGVVPSHLFQVERPVSREQWTDLTTTPAASTSPDQVAEAWQFEIEGQLPLHVASGPNGLAHCLLANGDVVIVNASGGEDDRIPASVFPGMQAVPRIAVDSDGGVFVAATRDTEFGGVASVLVRLVKQETGIWDRVYVQEFEHRMTMFGYANGFLYVVLDPPEPASGPREEASLVRIAAPLASGAEAWRRSPIPRPVLDVTVGRGGAAILSSPSSHLRIGVDGTAFTTRSVAWTPHELAAPSKLFSWVSADYVNDATTPPEDGTPISVMGDRRKLPNEFAEFGGPDRELRKPPTAIWKEPTYDESAFGGLGGVRIGKDSALRSGPNTGTTDEEQEALIPGDGTGYGFVFAVQLDRAHIDAGTIGNLFTQRTTNTGELDLAVIANADNLTANDLDTAAATNNANTTTASPGGSNAAIVSFIVTAGGTNPAWRINGTDVFSPGPFANLLCAGQYNVGGYGGGALTDLFTEGPRTVFGDGVPNESNIVALPGTVWNPGAAWIGNPPPSLDLIRNGNNQDGVKSGRNLAGGTFQPELDFGAVAAIDSITIVSPDFTGGSVQVTIGNDATFAAFNHQQTYTTEEMEFEEVPDSRRPDRRRWALRLSSAIPILGRYCRLVFANAGGTDEVDINELGLFSQELNNATQPAEFSVYEIVAVDSVTGAADADIERIEGYLAHKVGLSHELAGGHTYASNPPASSATIQDPGGVAVTLRSRFPILSKWGPDGDILAAFTGAGVGLGAATFEDKILTWGEPDPLGAGTATGVGTIGRQVLDNGASLSLTGTGTWTISAGAEVPLIRRTPVQTGPCGSMFVHYQPDLATGGTAYLRRYTAATGALSWQVAASSVVGLSTGGLQIDESALGGACGPEFLYAAFQARQEIARVDVTGRFDTGVPDYVAVDVLGVSSGGDIKRLDDEAWTTVSAAGLTGERPWSAYLYGVVIIGDGRNYRVYDAFLRTIRDFTQSVKGYLPPRAKLATPHRGRLYLAAADNPYALYASRYGDPFDFDLAPVIEDVAQAFAGTTSAQGTTPERITALIPYRDDVLLIGTDRGQYALTGDPGEGGRIDQVDTSNGVAFGYAWCFGSMGLYYFSRSGGLWRRTQQGAELLSAGRVQRRLEDIDQDTYRIELAYRWQDRTVHVFVIPRAGFQENLQHFVYDEQLGAFHLDRFVGGVGRQVTAVATLEGQTSADRTLALGFGDGYVRKFASWAEDDDGIPIASGAIVGPLLPPNDTREASMRAIYGQLASDLGPVMVGARGSTAPDVPGPVTERGTLEPGRGRGVAVRASGPALYYDIRGMGRGWSIHELEAEARAEGMRKSR